MSESNESGAMKFTALHPWAILPRKVKIDTSARVEESRLMEEHFVWVRKTRSAELCWPSRMGQEIGWVVDSPVTVTMDALHDIEAIGPPESLRQLSMLANASENWCFRDAEGKPNRIHFTRNAGWTALYDFKVGNGRSDRMFFLNGEGSLEWVLGWEPSLPSTHAILLIPYEPIPNLEVLTGVLTAGALAKGVGKTNGFSIGIRPTGPVTIQRGQPVARIILLHPDSLRDKVTDS